MKAFRRIKLSITGRVQNVGYRWFACTVAQKRQVVGYIINEEDGSVTAEAEGRDVDIESFVADLERGPNMANVSDVKVTSLSVLKQETEFNIKSW